MLNPPAKIRGTGRADNARLLGNLEGVITPRTVNLPRELLCGPNAIPTLEQHGLAFPILLRVPGFHAGDYFVRVDRPDDLDLGRDPNRHLTFAFGKHFCLGNQLARMEGQIAIRSLMQRFPNMSLAVPREQLRYKPIQALRGLRSLPLHMA